MNPATQPSVRTEALDSPRFVLIDDDPAYCAVMSRVAETEGVNLEVYPSLMALGSVGLLGRYDLAIVDYQLESFNGIEIAEYLSHLFGDLPMILISQTKRYEKGEKWPDCIKCFVDKSQGYQQVFEQAKRHARSSRPVNKKPLSRDIL